MRFTLMLFLMLAGQATWGATVAQMNLKKSMISDADTILAKITETQADLKAQRYQDACDLIKDIYDIYPRHLTNIGVHMDILKGSVYKIRNEALQQLIFFHKQTLVCQSAENCENIDPKYLSSQLKEIEKSVKKQKKAIEKDNMENENSFHYEYCTSEKACRELEKEKNQN